MHSSKASFREGKASAGTSPGNAPSFTNLRDL
jgi:hypothetical protein